MSDKSAIEWTDATWNPVRGCSRVSEGCRHCYAERVAARFSGAGQPYEGLAVMKSGGAHWTGEVRLVAEHLADPLKWRKPRRIFVNSMSDLFHEKLSDADIDRVFAVMALCPQHTFQVLTKRPARMLNYLCATNRRAAIALQANAMMRSDRRAGNSDALVDIFTWQRRAHAAVGEYVNYLAGISDTAWPLPNVWLGVSVEDQQTANERIPLLLQTPAAVRWVSAEPLLGLIDLSELVNDDGEGEILYDALTGRAEVLHSNSMDCISDEPDNPRLSWIVVGGESGHGARPMHPDWARNLRDQCQAAGVPFFFKQWGEWAAARSRWGTNDFVFPDGIRVRRHGKAAGRLLDGREWNEYPNDEVAIEHTKGTTEQ